MFICSLVNKSLFYYYFKLIFSKYYINYMYKLDLDINCSNLKVKEKKKKKFRYKNEKIYGI